MSTYRIRSLQGNVYQVIEADEYDGEHTVFQGSISDCEAYIRLAKDGYI